MAIVFDFDGVLVDTRHDNLANINSLAEKYRYDTMDIAGYNRMCEHNFYEYWTMLLGPRAAAFFQDLHVIPRPHTKLLPGMADILREHQPAIVSSNATPVIRAVLRDNGVHLPGIFGGDIEHSKVVKLNRLRGQPNVFVTDTAGDVHEGKRAGYTIIAVTWGFNSPQQLERARPHRMVSSADELHRLLVQPQW